ncbi:hypothetical protein [Streptomyces sp. NPDC048272]|uniref:hypothetical protein n=1 Tax=Streptomyces sp. NPDC048272 TaxID=3154616 RepID=UPI003437DF65
MTYRFGVLADSAESCAEGLALLARLAELGGARWIARAVPTTKAPAGGEGLVDAG